MDIANAIEYLQPIADSSHIKNYKDAINTVIEAAKKQIPQEPEEAYRIGVRFHYSCQCGQELDFVDTGFNPKEKATYCPGCGQRMKWPAEKDK